MIRNVVLAVHVLAGTAGLALGLMALRAIKRSGPPTGWVGPAYHWTVLVVAASATLLAVLSWSELWWFVPVAIGSYAFALVAYLAARRGRPGWFPVHVRGQGGSYIALWTAVLVVNTSDTPLLWAVPTLVGTPWIERVCRNARVG